MQGLTGFIDNHSNDRGGEKCCDVTDEGDTSIKALNARSVAGVSGVPLCVVPF